MMNKKNNQKKTNMLFNRMQMKMKSQLVKCCSPMSYHKF